MPLRTLLVGGSQHSRLIEQLEAANQQVLLADPAAGDQRYVPDNVDRADCVVVTDACADVVRTIESIHKQSPQIPIVLAADNADTALVTKAVRAGVVDYVNCAGSESIVSRIRAAVNDVSPAKERERALSKLYDAAQRLLLATDPETIASITVGAASDALDLSITGVYRDEGDALVPIAQTEEVDKLFGDIVLDPNSSLAGESFRRGETRVIEDVRTHEDTQNPETPIRTELHVPFADEYLLVSGSTERRQFDEYQIDFAELLATTAEAAIRRARRDAELEQYETVFRTIDERVCVIGADRTIRMANEALARFLDTDPASLVGRPALAFVDDADAAAVAAAVEALEDGTSTTVEAQVGPTAGDRQPCEIDTTTLPADATIDGVVAAIRDISDRKRVESALEQERNRFVELFEHVQDPLVEAEIIDGEPYIRSTNAAFRRTFGADDAVGDRLNDYVLPPEDDGHASALDSRLAAGEQIETEIKRETDDGIRYFLFRGVPIDTVAQDTQLAFGIYTDITEQRLRERRLSVLNRVFRHNIRNDMNVVIGRAEYLKDADDPEEVTTHAESIRRNAQGIVDLADGIHAAEQALSADDAPTRAIDDVVTETVAAYSSQEGVSVSVHVPDEALPAIDERLQVAVEELLENAIEHADRTAVSVVVTVEQTEQGVTVAVSDNGPGIPTAERTAIKSGMETSLDHGSGVGLWLVRWITTALGGEVEVAVDNGTTVSLTFPPTALQSRPGRCPDRDDRE